ncbi:sensor histidine kinase [Marichromatium bheemlicum]|uniref:histidine kinase n=1 Tax=Marichromatium bheemlicum TaxID=365339 RepID=A0ABX1I3I5_9GAMM|nr:ATP-binding protein [Marichromatium bheemlicum]NKN32064.1 HAMP domain-containing protein [Marichromatium bheemlicum]
MAPASVSRLRGLGLGTLPVAILIAALFVVLVLMRDSVTNSEALSRAFVPLLFAVLAGLGMLALLVGFNVVRLVRRYRQQAAGSRLTARIVALFAVLSLLPVGTVYYFSLGFLLRGIDSWFDVEIGQAMEDALVLNQASLDLNQRVLAKYTEQLLVSIEDRSSTAIALSLDSLRRQAGAIELTVYGGGGQVLANASEDPTKLVPNHAEREIQQSVRAGNNYVGLDSVPGADLVVRVLVNDPLGRPMQMQAIFPTSARIGELSGQLEAAYNRYTELAYLRNSLKLSFSLTLSLVLLFSLMAALIVAFHTARRLVAPVADIARASRAIAEGNYEQQIPLPRHDDELAFLVASFNAMSRRIARARDEAERSQQAVETQRNYLETVLGRLSSGVVALDAEHRLRTANPAARAILDLAIAETTTPVDLDQIAAHHPWLSPWTDTVHHQVVSGRAWRAEVRLQRQEGSQTLMCRGSPLPGGDDEAPGHVVVFDDITSLITAQREAAWGEVARRLAHEIKNPLTPIQLSAERLRHKLLRKAEEADARVIDRATHTIIQQVEAMKAMVNDFSDYARSPQLRPEPLVFDRLVREVLDLYRSAGAGALEVRLAAGPHQINGDALRLRQVLHNLIKNAQEALEGRADGCIHVTTGVREEAEQQRCWLEVSDNGPGFEPHLMERLFEPYVTTKAKGTGLGLAIVKRIIEEHGGIIVVENTASGARIEIRLPVWQPPLQDAQARGTQTET